MEGDKNTTIFDAITTLVGSEEFKTDERSFIE